MIVNRVRNVCQALPKTVELLLSFRAEKSRAGDVLVAPHPVMTVYEQPRERVLFSAVRDANPFFHVVEALWMLAGRDDAKTLDRFIKDFGTRYGEPDGRVHDAYGRRWRIGFDFDQLDEMVRRLYQSPQDRQCVITMWDPSLPAECRSGECDPDQEAGHNDLLGVWRGRPCNTHAYLRVLDESRLNMTVCCRSNDMILGGHGANAVHFSVLQEYLAARLGIAVGVLYQLSNNCHVYVSELERIWKRVNLGVDRSGPNLVTLLSDDRYSGGLAPMPMFDDPNAIDEDLAEFFARMDHGGNIGSGKYYNLWFRNTLCPMMQAHDLYVAKKMRTAHLAASRISSVDWRQACTEWLERRM